MIDKDFFKKYQKSLLWFVNTSFGRWYFRIHKDCPKDKKIIRILPNNYTWDNEDKTHSTDFRVNNKFSFRLNALFSWLPFYAYKRIELGGQWFLQPKFGLTVSTFYPDASAIDGYVQRNVDPPGEDWATINAGAGTFNQDAGAYDRIDIEASTTSDKYVLSVRAIMLFDTSSLPDTDSISEAILSIYGDNKANVFGSSSLDIVSSNPQFNTELNNPDYGTLGTTSFANITYTNFSTTGYNDLTLNASGIANISKTGISKFGGVYHWYITGTPTWASEGFESMRWLSARTTGTSSDPKLVVTHAASSAIKTIDGLAKSSVKTVNGLAVASVKTWGGLA